MSSITDSFASGMAAVPPAVSTIKAGTKSSVREDGWTAEKRAAFIDKLRDCLSVSRSAESVFMSRTSAYALKRRDPEFAESWDEAIDDGVQCLRDIAFEEALETRVVEKFDRKGNVTSRTEKVSERLLIFLLSRYDKNINRDFGYRPYPRGLSRPDYSHETVQSPASDHVAPKQGVPEFAAPESTTPESAPPTQAYDHPATDAVTLLHGETEQPDPAEDVTLPHVSADTATDTGGATDTATDTGTDIDAGIDNGTEADTPHQKAPPHTILRAEFEKILGGLIIHATERIERSEQGHHNDFTTPWPQMAGIKIRPFKGEEGNRYAGRPYDEQEEFILFLFWFMVQFGLRTDSNSPLYVAGDALDSWKPVTAEMVDAAYCAVIELLNDPALAGHNDMMFEALTGLSS